MPAPTRLPPFVHRSIAIERITIHLAELPGDGPPALLLHGIGMTWRVWQAVARRLHPYFRLYLVDLRGHGTSGKPAHGYSIAQYAADIEDVIDSLTLTDVMLIGSSLGGVVAAAVEAPADIVSHRVLVDPPLTGGPVRDADMFADILRLKHQPMESLAAYLEVKNPEGGRRYAEILAAMWQEAADGVVSDMLATRDNYFAIDAALKAVDAPTLLLQADPGRGGVLTDAQAQRALDLLPRGTWKQVPGAGHAIHATNPREFTELVVRFSETQ